MELQKRLKREGGFTLIELIAVIIILGILAAVIVPKYFDMTSKAQDAAYKGALNEGVARLNMAYSAYVLDTSSKPAAIANLQNSTLLGTTTGVLSIGDYTITYGTSGTNTTLALTMSSATGTALKWANGTTPVTISVPWPQ